MIVASNTVGKSFGRVMMMRVSLRFIGSRETGFSLYHGVLNHSYLGIYCRDILRMKNFEGDLFELVFLTRLYYKLFYNF